jgi:predicted O-methyltransferase YrrM
VAHRGDLTVLRRFRSHLLLRTRRWLDPWHHLDSNVLEVRSFAHLKIALGWTRDPILEGEHLHAHLGLNDLNDRRLRDAEVIAGACANEAGKIALEIGTAHGLTTALMAVNAPHATVHTVNIPPEDIGTGGVYTTFAPAHDQIGLAWRERKLSNVVQILANTATWEPDFGPIDVALIDGCHDTEFVYGDTRKVLARCREGSLILWHDFHPGLRRVYPWIASVCRGVERLYQEGLLRGNILHLQDSWVGLYRVPFGGGR